MPHPALAALLAVAALAGRAQTPGGETVYRYLEAEKPAAARGIAFRDEGFTAWMGHPSGGRTVIFGGEAEPFAAWPMGDLPRRPLYLFVRQLAFAAPRASVEARVDGVLLGVTAFQRPGTMLAWSRRLGPFTAGPASTLTLRPATGSEQAPYLDVLLITTDPECVPDGADQDYRSATLRADRRGLSVSAVRTLPIVGRTGVALSVANPGGPRRLTVRLTARDEAGGPPAITSRVCTVPPGLGALRVGWPGAPGRRYTLRVEALNETGELLFQRAASLTVIEGAQARVAGVCFAPGEPIVVHAALNDPELAARHPRVSAVLSAPGHPPVRAAVRASGPEARLALPTAGLPAGRWRLSVRIDGLEALAEPLRAIRLLPRALERLEPIRRVEATGSGIRLNGRPFVPRKLYHASGTPAVKAQGFNCVDCWGGDTLEGVERMLDEAWANNLYGYGILFHPYFYKGIGKGWDLSALERGVTRLKSHPALLLWELYDEPDAGVPVAELEAARALIRRLDPDHPVLLNFCFPAKFREYAGPCDIVSVDVYPVPSAPTTLVADYLDRLRQAVDGRKPLQIALQTYGDVKGRMPTLAELRSMTYLSINHDARSFAFYSYAEGAGYPFCLEADPILWSYTRELNAELRELTGLIAAAPAPGAVAGPPSLDLRAWRTGAGLTVVAVNRTPRHLRAALRLGPGSAGAAAVLFEARALRVDDRGALADDFGPHGVHVYRLGAR